MNTSPRKLSLVLSGGGARGSFQVGVWKALRQLGVENRIGHVFGTSVGAINGAAFVQGDLELTKELWNLINYSTVFDQKVTNGQTRPTRRYYYSLAKAVVRDKGLNVEPLKQLLREHLSEEKIRASPLSYGLVVYDLKKRLPRYMSKEDIPEGKLVEYVIASATFPLFQPHRIDGELFIDGGIYDNRPLKFTVKYDTEKVICVDVTMARHFWPRKSVSKNVEVDYVRPSRLLGSPLAFRHPKIQRNMELGYNDALRQLTKLLTEKESTSDE